MPQCVHRFLILVVFVLLLCENLQLKTTSKLDISQEEVHKGRDRIKEQSKYNYSQSNGIEVHIMSILISTVCIACYY